MRVSSPTTVRRASVFMSVLRGRARRLATQIVILRHLRGVLPGPSAAVESRSNSHADRAPQEPASRPRDPLAVQGSRRPAPRGRRSPPPWTSPRRGLLSAEPRGGARPVFLLTLALPKRLRQYDLNEASYRVYSLVRGVRRRPTSRGRSDVLREVPPTRVPGAARGALTCSLGLDHQRPGPPGPARGRDALRRCARGEPGRRRLGSRGSPSLDTLVGARTARTVPRPSPRPTTRGQRLHPARPHRVVHDPEEPRRRAACRPSLGHRHRSFYPSEDVPLGPAGGPRVDLFVNFTIQLVDEWGAVLQES